MTSGCARTDEFITTVAREKQEMKAAKEAALAKEMEALGTPDQVRANETSVPEVFPHVTLCALDICVRTLIFTQTCMHHIGEGAPGPLAERPSRLHFGARPAEPDRFAV